MRRASSANYSIHGKKIHVARNTIIDDVSSIVMFLMQNMFYVGEYSDKNYESTNDDDNNSDKEPNNNIDMEQTIKDVDNSDDFWTSSYDPETELDRDRRQETDEHDLYDFVKKITTTNTGEWAHCME